MKTKHLWTAGLVALLAAGLVVFAGGRLSPVMVASASAGDQLVASHDSSGDPPPAEWTPSEPYKDKIVPLLSMGEGRRIGAARVSGPASQVDLVQAVVTLETHWRSAVEITAYVPISTKEPGQRLSRVQGCAVTAIGDLGF